MKTVPESATGTAHGKIILMGEHAVVYGEPAIAMPFKAAPVTVTIEKTDADSRLNSYYYKGFLSEAPQSLENLKVLIARITEELNQTADHLSLTISSLIPAERGMGSSAAVATALVRALYSYFGEPLNTRQLLYYVDMSEKIAHGNPSGLDARVTSSDTPVFYKKGSVFEPISLNLKGYLIAADTGIKGQTAETVADVARLVSQQPEEARKKLKGLGELTLKAKDAIEQNQVKTLGTLMTQAHGLLKQLDVSDDRLDRLVAAALSQGAQGAKLTGGGRGGCMIALTESRQDAEAVAKKLLEQGAANTWIHALGADNNE